MTLRCRGCIQDVYNMCYNGRKLNMLKVLGWKRPAELWLSGAFCRDVISRNLKKHFCLTSTTFYVSSVHVFDICTWHMIFFLVTVHYENEKKNSFGLCILAVCALNNQSLGVFFLLFRMLIQFLRISPSHSDCHVFITHLLYCLFCFFNMNHTIRFTLALWGTSTFWDSLGFDANKE